jgi:type I restriction enzyme S subunit
MGVRSISGEPMIAGRGSGAAAQENGARNTPSVDSITNPSRPRFKPYSAYKDSGVEWLGAIPAHWEVKRLKAVASVQLSNVDKKSLEGQEPVRLCNYVDVYYNERITSDLDFMAATATPEQVRRFSLDAGDVLITKDSESWTDIAVPAVVAQDLPGVLCGYHLALIRPTSTCQGEFLARAFAAIGPRDQFQLAANGITRFGLGGDAIRTGMFAMPPEPEQRAIAAFLDRETPRIDALLAKKEQLVQLLQEKRIALITRAVTKGLPAEAAVRAGLDPNVPLKDSGVQWLGEIPAHWEVKPLKAVSLLQTGLTLGKRYEGRSLATRPYLRVANVQDGYLALDDIAEVELPVQDAARFELRKGDVLMTEGGDFDKLGRGHVWEGEVAGCLHQNHIFAVRPRRDVLSPRFLALAMGSAYGRAYFTATSKQSTNLASTNSTKLRNLPMPLPTLWEQDQIVRWIDRQARSIDGLIAKVRDAIDHLKELRTALISAAVTGKIDVRDEQPRNPASSGR